jgi:signal transduction histidine kinase
VVIVWDEAEEPWQNVAEWTGAQFSTGREPPDRWSPLAASPLEGASFACGRGGVVTGPGHEAAAGFAGPPVHEGFRERFPFRSALSVPLAGVQVSGRLFWLDRGDVTVDDLLPAEIVGRQVAVQLDQLGLLQRLRRAAASDARVKIARDLHDGLLQSLAATGLQLETARSLLDRDPQTARAHLAEARRVLAAEQRDLRSLIAQLHPDFGSGARPSPPLHARVEELAERIGRQRGISVSVGPGVERLSLSPPVAHHAYFLVHEAVVNAGRHSGARSIRVDLAPVPGGLRLDVADDGRGFPFRGRLDQAALAAAGAPARCASASRRSAARWRSTRPSRARGSRCGCRSPGE